MANSTLLSLFQTTLQGMGVVTYGLPATVIGNANQDVTQTLALLNTAGGELGREREWQAMRKQYLFTAPYYVYTGDTNTSTSLTNMSSIANLDSTYMVVGGSLPQDTFVVSASGTTVILNQAALSSQTGQQFTFSKTLFAPATDFDRLVDRTQWDKSKHWEMLGPSTPQQEEWLRSGYISTGPRIRYWMQQGYFQIWPPQGSTESLSYEYISKWWIQSTGSMATTKELFTADTDTCIFPDPLMRILIKMKYFEIKGFDTTAIYRDYMKQLDIAKANDGGSPTLNQAPRPADVLIGWANIPDSTYGT